MDIERGTLQEISGAYITGEAMLAILDRQCSRCAVCNAPITICSAHFDLVKPIIRGGNHTIENFQALCISCHQNLMRQFRERFANNSPGHPPPVRK